MPKTSAAKPEIASLEALITALGGSHMVAAEAGISDNAVRQWRTRGLPRWARFFLYDLARRRRLRVSPGALGEPTPDRRGRAATQFRASQERSVVFGPGTEPTEAAPGRARRRPGVRKPSTPHSGPQSETLRPIDSRVSRGQFPNMAENATPEFLGAQMECMLADQGAMRDDIGVLTAIALRHENTLKNIAEQMRDMLGQMRAMVAQHSRFNDRLHRLEEQPTL